MDLLAKLQEAYGSSSDEDDGELKYLVKPPVEMIKSSVAIIGDLDLAPDVNVSDLQL